MNRQRPFFFHHQLGYRQNPFGALTTEEGTAVAFWPAPVEAVVSAGCRHLQLTGVTGCGKTSTLLKLAAHFKQEGRPVVYEYMPEGQSRFKTEITTGTVFVLDEAQRLSRTEKKRWLAAAAQAVLIFSSHRDLAADFVRRGYALQTVALDEHITEAYYQRWIDSRLAYFALPTATTRTTLTPAAVRVLKETFGNNMRGAEYFLYEMFQGGRRPSNEIDERAVEAALRTYREH